MQNLKDLVGFLNNETQKHIIKFNILSMEGQLAVIDMNGHSRTSSCNFLVYFCKIIVTKGVSLQHTIFRIPYIIIARTINDFLIAMVIKVTNSCII